MTGIYMIRNKENGKVYIGQSVDIEKRWKDHRWLLRHGKHHSPHLQRAYNQNPQSLVYEVVMECPEDMLNTYEDMMIQRYRADEAEYGYNIAHKAEGHGRLPPEIIARISEKKKGRDCAHMRGRKLDPVWCQHISDAQTNKKKVICLETDDIYDSAVCASKQTGLDRAHIASCCKIHSRTIGGYHWAFYDDYLERPEFYADIVQRRSNLGHPKNRRVVCIETGTVYLSVKSAAESTKTERTSICACCAGRLKTAGGFHWAYYDEYHSERTYPMAV